jgi:glycosyltransferase involved in cell wall biosynthesis
VATRVSGNGEAVSHNETGFLSPPNDPAGLARTIVQMIEARHRWREFGRAGLLRCHSLFDGRSSIGTLLDRFYGLPLRAPKKN